MLADGSRFDLIVIGGGINGAAIAREAALSGVDVLLLERDDFGAGTSATSTRLIHGGLRYLEHAEFPLVYESLAERERLLETAPHLVEPLEILLPLFRGSRRGRLKVRLGMWLYDLLSVSKSLPSHRMLNRAGMLEALPGLNRNALVGGAAYFDAQVSFPERLVLENALDAEAAGATLAPHTACRELLVESGSVQGVVFEGSGAKGRAFAPVVVNATGPWVDELLQPLGRQPLIGGTKGSHLIAQAFGGAPEKAIYAEAGSDARPFFVIPWNGLFLIGTTDERYAGDPSSAEIDEREFRYLIAETRRLFPAATDLEERVCYTCAGIRPLPATDGVRESAITRRHVIRKHDAASGLYSIVGGKLTTHRALAVDCMKKLKRTLSVSGGSPTANRPLPGALDPQERDALIEEVSQSFNEATARRFWRTYGGASRMLLASVRESPELAQAVSPNSDLIVGELVHGIERERAESLVDLLQRRTMTGLGSDFGKLSVGPAADWLVRLKIWDKGRADREIEEYRRYARRHSVPVPRSG